MNLKKREFNASKLGKNILLVVLIVFILSVVMSGV